MSAPTKLSGTTISENQCAYEADTKKHYLGYRENDYAKPFSKYFHLHTDPISEDVQKGLSSSPFASGLAYSPKDAGRVMSLPGYHNMETGWTVGDDRVLLVALRTDIPNISGDAYDWWFGWHLVDSSRYKLWNPVAHQFAWRHPETMDWASKSLPERYIGTHSFINEYVGKDAANITVAFIDPSELGFDRAKFEEQGIEAVVAAKLLLGEHRTSGFDGKSYLVHQVRRMTNRKRELRSRFWMGTFDNQVAHDLVVHCNIEINHLNKFLPELYEEFKDRV